MMSPSERSETAAASGSAAADPRADARVVSTDEQSLRPGATAQPTDPPVLPQRATGSCSRTCASLVPLIAVALCFVVAIAGTVYYEASLQVPISVLTAAPPTTSQQVASTPSPSAPITTTSVPSAPTTTAVIPTTTVTTTTSGAPATTSTTLMPPPPPSTTDTTTPSTTLPLTITTGPSRTS